MEKIYRLASAAERDLLDILAYTNRHWGSARAEKYVAHIEACLEAIVKGRVREQTFSGARNQDFYLAVQEPLHFLSAPRRID